MKKIDVTKSRAALSGPDISRVEKQLGVVLPDDYRKFLLQHNGGRPKLKVFPIYGDLADDQALLEHFYCISDGDEYDLARNEISLRGRLPKDMLAIGEDPGGNYICISLSNKDFGRIYYWDHEGELENITTGQSNLYFVANSFGELLELLHELPE